MKISTGSAVEAGRCAQRLISDESGWTSRGEIARRRFRRQGKHDGRPHLLQTDVERQDRRRRRQHQRRGARQCKGAGRTARRGVTADMHHARHRSASHRMRGHGLHRSHARAQHKTRLTAADADHEAHRDGRVQTEGAQRQQRQPASSRRFVQACKEQDSNPGCAEPCGPDQTNSVNASPSKYKGHSRPMLMLVLHKLRSRFASSSARSLPDRGGPVQAEPARQDG